MIIVCSVLAVKQVSKKKINVVRYLRALVNLEELFSSWAIYVSCVQNQHISKSHVPQLDFELEPVVSGLSIQQFSSMPARSFIAFPSKAYILG